MTDELKALLKRCKFNDAEELEVEEILIIPSTEVVNEFDANSLQYMDRLGVHIPYKQFSGMTLIGINHRPKEEAFILGTLERMEFIKFWGGRRIHIDVPTCYGYPRVISAYPFKVEAHIRDAYVKVRDILCPTKKK